MTVTTQEGSWAPLAGLRVLDFSAQLPGPMATLILADLGADIIKIEPPMGEFGRQIRGGMFGRLNRHKRSLAVDLKAAASRAVTDRLIARADVLIETFRPGVAERLGLGPEVVRARQERIIYCSLSGYGQTGPWRERPGHDISYLAAAGAMSLAGEWNQAPRRSGLPVGDIAGGAFAVSAILAALAERNTLGKGRYLDLALFDAAIYATGTRTAFNDENGPRDHLFPTQGSFATSDGRTLALALVENHFWLKFLRVAATIDPELSDPRFATPQGRFEAGDEVYERIRVLIANRSASQWMALFEGTDVPIQICLSASEAGLTPQVRARGLLYEEGERKYSRFPVIADHALRPAHSYLPAPEVGQHSADILRELGFTEGQIADFFKDGVVVQPDTAQNLNSG
jgi:crotonobetainyl-CoA:carnitine CoA-transferase CaiB-like acyl-CoA transferase